MFIVLGITYRGGSYDKRIICKCISLDTIDLKQFFIRRKPKLFVSIEEEYNYEFLILLNPTLRMSWRKMSAGGTSPSLVNQTKCDDLQAYTEYNSERVRIETKQKRFDDVGFSSNCMC